MSNDQWGYTPPEVQQPQYPQYQQQDSGSKAPLAVGIGVLALAVLSGGYFWLNKDDQSDEVISQTLAHSTLTVERTTTQTETSTSTQNPSTTVTAQQQSQSSQNTGRVDDQNFIHSVTLSNGVTKTATSAPCDGRYIHILNSVIDNGSDIPAQLAQALASDSRAEFATPGMCPSVRAQIEGQWVYPVYVDYGTDLSAACSARASEGGNVRQLTNSGNFKISECE